MACLLVSDLCLFCLILFVLFEIGYTCGFYFIYITLIAFIFYCVLYGREEMQMRCVYEI